MENEIIKASSIAASTPRGVFGLTVGVPLIVNNINMTDTSAQFWADRIVWWTKQLKADPNLNIDFTKVVVYEHCILGVLCSILSDRIVSLGVDNNGTPLFVSPALVGTDDNVHAKATSQSKQNFAKLNGIQIDENLYNIIINIIRPVRADNFGTIFLTLYIDTSANWGNYLNTIFDATYRDEYARALANIKLKRIKTIETSDCDMMLSPSFCLVDDDLFVSKTLTTIETSTGVGYVFYCNDATTSIAKFSMYTDDINRAINYWFAKHTVINATTSINTSSSMSLTRPDTNQTPTANISNIRFLVRNTTTIPKYQDYTTTETSKLILQIAAGGLIGNNINSWFFQNYDVSPSSLNPSDPSDCSTFDLWLFDYDVTLLGTTKTIGDGNKSNYKGKNFDPDYKKTFRKSNNVRRSESGHKSGNSFIKRPSGNRSGSKGNSGHSDSSSKSSSKMKSPKKSSGTSPRKTDSDVEER